MPLHPSGSDIALRIALTLIAGAAIGYNREQHGRPAGLRTTILVALAACVAMIQANELLPVGGKTPASFSVMDVMRLPLGILSGIGIIGAGAILRRGEMLMGVTTAATLWIATVVGLCFGGGQILLAAAGAVIAVAVLWSGAWFDRRLPKEQRGSVVMAYSAEPPRSDELDEVLRPLHGRARLCQSVASGSNEHPTATYALRWPAPAHADQSSDLLRLLRSRFEILSLSIDS